MKIRLSLRAACWTACGLLAAAAVAELALRFTPFPRPLAEGWPASAEFLDRDGHPLRLMLVEEKRFSRRCSLGEVSPHVIDATLSAEDRRFRQHGGIDPLALGRACLSWVREAQPASGASTITQQLVKLAQPGARTLPRKLSEMWLALCVERVWSKNRILEEYLNRLDYGNLQTGIAAASRYYFGKPPLDLSPAEAAFLASLPKAPTRLNPHRNPTAACERQQWVLRRMRECGVLGATDYERAVVEPLRLAVPRREFEAPYFVDLLLQRRGILVSEGAAIRTTLDLELNRFVEQSLTDQLRKIADKHATSAAAVVIHNPTGDVLALAGPGDYFQPGTGQVNGAWSVRSPGSAVKPFTYILALERGANPCTVVPDLATDFSTPTGLYRPNNYNHRFYGPVSLRFALGNSLNVGAIRALELAGGPEALHRRMRDLGVTTLGHPAEHYGLGLTLGNGEMRLLELASAFGTIGRMGLHRPYRLLLRDPGNVQAGRRVCDARATYLVADMLSDNTARAASFGMNSYLSFDFPVACKTGTSSDYRDNWALGCTPEFTVGVWVGNADGSPMRAITGVTGAAPVMHEVLTHLRQQRGTSAFPQPAGIQEYTIHPLTGRQVAEGSAGAMREKCLRPPAAAASSDFDSQGRILLPAEYAQWLASAQNTLGNLVTGAEGAAALHILQPLPGTIYYLDPDLPRAAQSIALRAEATGSVEWSSATLAVVPEGGVRRVKLQEGRHVLSARDSATGRTQETWIEVKAL